MRSLLLTRTLITAGLSAVLLAVTAGRVSAQDPTEAELRRLTEAYAQAWAKADAKGVAGLHTSEAVHIDSGGKVSVGRAAIERSMTEALTGPYRGTKIGLTNGQTTRAGQDVYVTEGTFTISGGMTPAGMATRGRYLATIVRVSGRWQLAGLAEIGAPRPGK